MRDTDESEDDCCEDQNPGLTRPQRVLHQKAMEQDAMERRALQQVSEARSKMEHYQRIAREHAANARELRVAAAKLA